LAYCFSIAFAGTGPPVFGKMIPEEKMSGREETTLEELLREPIIRQLMASYGVGGDEIRSLFKDVRTRSVPTHQPADRDRNAA
jgi:hypothetical protein